MKVLLASKIVSKTMGSERVLISTSQWLKKSGIDAEIWTPESCHISEALQWADVFHWFNHGGKKDEWIPVLSEVKKSKKPVIATATYWPLMEGELKSGIKILEIPAEDTASLVYFRLCMDRDLAEILEYADAVIATSRTELQMVHGLMGFWNRKLMRTAIIPNAIDDEEISGHEVPWSQRSMQLIQVGRIEVAKNQIRVLSAFTRLKRRYSDAVLIMVGRGEKTLETRFEPLFSQDGVIRIGEIPFNLLGQIIKQSRGHVLPSFRDTPGLASLEAAACGCNVVVSRGFGTPHDYFMDKAIYVDPMNDLSIEDGMEQAMFREPDPALKEVVLSRFTYKTIVQGLIKLYTMAHKHSWPKEDTHGG